MMFHHHKTTCVTALSFDMFEDSVVGTNVGDRYYISRIVLYILMYITIHFIQISDQIDC